MENNSKEPKLLENGGKFEDERGEIWTTFKEKNKAINHIKITTNTSKTFRGFHGDTKTEKYTSCIKGRMTVLIICPENKNYWKYNLSAEKAESLYIPSGYLHGYYSEEESIYIYQLIYEGEYTDENNQTTLYLEDSCIDKKLKSELLMTGGLKRSKRDIKDLEK